MDRFIEDIIVWKIWLMSTKWMIKAASKAEVSNILTLQYDIMVYKYVQSLS